MCPQRGHTQCPEDSNGCGPHNTLPAIQKHEHDTHTNIQFHRFTTPMLCYTRVCICIDDADFVLDTSGSGQQAQSPSFFLQQVEPLSHATDSLQGTGST